jgi:thiol:disulfide interchange protein DsbD
MLHVKSLTGIILIVLAFYFLGHSFPDLKDWARPSTTFLGAMLGVAAVGLLLGAVHRSFEEDDWPTRIAKGFGVALVCVGSFGFISGVMTPERTLTWEQVQSGETLDELIARAQASAQKEGRPIFMDFTAEWCAACKEIERDTFPDERVQKAAGRFVALQLDMTNNDDPAIEQTSERYEIRGLPTLILFDSEGNEAKRFNGDFVGPDRLVEAMNAVN